MWSNKHPHFECAPANRCVFHFISKGVLASKLLHPSSSTANTQSCRDFYMQMLLVETQFGVAGGGSKFSRESRCNFHCPTHTLWFYLGRHLSQPIHCRRRVRCTIKLIHILLSVRHYNTFYLTGVTHIFEWLFRHVLSA